MNLQQIITAVGETQDGRKINPNDVYGAFLMSLIRANTDIENNAGKVDTENLATDLKYAIHEFTKALKAVEKFKT